jgi:organic hydroperoxide reductase OsmC/OhrA
VSNRIIVIGWSMGGKIVQPVSEAAGDVGLDLDFYLSFAATPPVTGAISMDVEIAMAASGYADRSDLYAGWLEQLADNNADNGGRTIIDERTYLADYVGDMSINLQGYGLRYRGGAFIRDHWADVEDFKSYDFARLPTIAMIMPNEVADGRHALTDQANWGLFLTNKIMHGDIGGNEVDLEALPDERWFALIDVSCRGALRIGAAAVRRMVPWPCSAQRARSISLRADRPALEGDSMAQEHHFAAHLVWAGAAEGSTRDYESYSRAWGVEMEGRPPLEGSADAAFRGDPARHSPEDLLVAALSACHMLSYLHLCASAGIEVVAYEDQASGIMAIKDKRMRFTEVTLAPRVEIIAGDLEQARALHEKAHSLCFIANSVNFPVLNMPTVTRR